jgi:cysteine desulfuration protein SufE
LDYSNYPSALKSYIQDYKSLDDFELRAQALIELADGFTPPPQSIASAPYPESAKVPGCESEAYLFVEANHDNSLNFYFAVQNPQGISAKALAQLLKQTLDGQPLAQVVCVPEDVVYELFGKNISMGKGLGLMGMVQMLKAVARKYLEATS